MPLRRKFFILFFIVAILPLFLTGILTFNESRVALTDRVVDGLEAVASVQEGRVNEAVDHYIGQVRLVSSRTQLRFLIHSFFESQDRADLEQVYTIINDARDSVQAIRDISIIDMQGEYLVSTRSSLEGLNASDRPYFAQGQQQYGLYEVFKDENNILNIRLVGPLNFDGKNVAVVEVIMDASSLIAITEDYSGLGDTGEIALAKKNSGGDAVFITPLRFDFGAPFNRVVPKERVDFPINVALSGEEGVLVDQGVIDYRGKSVLAVTRYIEALDWGLVVKIDRDEALAPIGVLLSSYLIVSIFATLLLIFFTYLAVNSFSRPITQLTSVASAIERGDFSKRAKVPSRDEVGKLAQAFNHMAEKLKESYEGLEKRVHERTEELKKFKLAAEFSMDGVVITNENFEFTYINPAMEKMSGRRFSEVKNKRATDFLKHETDTKTFITQVIQTVLKGQTFVSDEAILTTNDLPIRLAVYPITQEGKALFFVALAQDITLHKKMNKAKTEFVALTSHQLKTPLSSVNWYSEMLLDKTAGDLSVKQEKYVKHIHDSNRRMITLVKALLNVSRIEMGTIDMAPKPVDLSKILDTEVGQFKGVINKKQLKVVKKCSPNRILMTADENLISIIFQNLISNAIKYTHEKGKITITLKRVENEILFEVEDTGLGIPIAEQGRVFSKLFRAANVREKNVEGTGLGLYILKAIVDNCNGDIGFESGEGVGTRFYIRLPVDCMEAN